MEDATNHNAFYHNDPATTAFYDDYYGEYDIVEPCDTSNNNKVEQVVGIYVHSVICVLGLIGNTLVIVTYTFYKRSKSMTDVYLLNVALADLLFVVALPLIIYNEDNDWSMGAVACKVVRGVYSVNLFCGMLLLACISADRYVAIVHARRSFRLRSVFYGRVVCSAVWLLALALSSPTVYYYDAYRPKHLTGEVSLVCDFHLEEESTAPVIKDNDTASVLNNRDMVPIIKVLVPSIQMAVGFLLPLLVMLWCYSFVVATLLRSRNFQRHRAVRVVLAVVMVFLACHLPYNLALLVHTATKFNTKPCGQVDTLEVTLTVTKTVAYLHCCLNPVLYAFVGVKFRGHFRKILRDLWWCVGKRLCRWTPLGPHGGGPPSSQRRRFSSTRGSRTTTTSEYYVSAATAATTRYSIDGSSSDNGTSFTM